MHSKYTDKSIYNYTYTFRFRILCAEIHIALMQTEFCPRWPHNKKAKQACFTVLTCRHIGVPLVIKQRD